MLVTTRIVQFLLLLPYLEVCCFCAVNGTVFILFFSSFFSKVPGTHPVSTATSVEQEHQLVRLVLAEELEGIIDKIEIEHKYEALLRCTAIRCLELLGCTACVRNHSFSLLNAVRNQFFFPVLSDCPSGWLYFM